MLFQVSNFMVINYSSNRKLMITKGRVTEIWGPRGKTTLLRKQLKDTKDDSFAESLEATILGWESQTHGPIGSDFEGKKKIL